MFGSWMRLHLALAPLLWSMWRTDGASGAQDGAGATGDAAGATGSGGATAGSTGATGDPPAAGMSPDEVNRVVQQRLREERERIRGEEREALRAEAERLRMEAEGDLRGLLETANAELVELRPLRERATELETANAAALAAVRAQVETQMADLPEYVRAAIADRDPVSQLAYLAEHAPAIRAAQPGGGGVPATKTGGGAESGYNVNDYIAKQYGRRETASANSGS